MKYESWKKSLCKAIKWHKYTEVRYHFCNSNIFIYLKYFHFLFLFLFFKYNLYNNKVYYVYFSDTLLVSMTIFFFVPLIFPILDIVYPLNETRPRQQLYRVNYLIFNHEDYFFYVYFQLVWSSFVCVIIVIIFDWLYILIIHHNSGMFAVCG